MIAPAVMLRALEILQGTSKNGHRSAGTSDLPTNDSVLFSVDSVLFTPKMPAIAGCFNFSRSPC
jgi:hypothetical protein